MVLKGLQILRYSILLLFLLSCVGVVSSTGLTPVVTEYGKINVSVDGLGTADTGVIQVEKPVNATVRGAYLLATGTPSAQIANGTIKFEGNGINWDSIILSDQSSNDWYNYWADVTSIVQPIVDSAPAGRVNFNIVESINSGQIDGEVLAVIFDDPNQAEDNTVILLFGGQDPTGDSFEIGLSDSINKSNSNLAIDMGLAISYSYQGSQVSLIDVNGQRLTSSAGGQDDGAGSNGQLITVGGLDDSNSNPVDPSLTSPPNTRYDDELYNLLPLVSNGDTDISVFTQNPSNDDNIFFSYFFMKSTTAIVGEGIILSPSNATVYKNTQHTLTASLQDDSGDPLANKDVTFTVISGPHNGTTFTNTTDSNGQTTFSYTGTSGGLDTVKATFVGDSDETITSNLVNVGWTSQYSAFIEFSENGNSTYATSHGTIVNVTNSSAYNQSLQYSWIQNSSIGAVGSWTSFNNGDLLTKNSVNGDWYLHIKALNDASNVNYSISSAFKLDNELPVYNWVQKILTANTGENITIELNATDNIEIAFGNISVDGQNYEMVQNSSNYLWNISIPASNSGTLVSSIVYNCTFIDLAGNINTTEDININVSILPIANFSVNATRGVSPLSVYFQDNSSGLVENWHWDFGDGNTSTDQNPIHDFGSGNFTVNLTVSNGNGTSMKYLNIRAAQDPVYSLSPEDSEILSIYGDEFNFSVNTTLFSSYEWFIDGTTINGSGVDLYANLMDSSKNSYCNINTSQYIDQNDFFMEVYNVSVNVSNESIGRTDIFSWEWTVTNSSANDENEIDFLVNKTPEIVVLGNESNVHFNSTDNNRTDSNSIPFSLQNVSFNTSGNTSGVMLKVEVMNVSSLNESMLDFPIDSVYQYFDIGFNNETLVNNESSNQTLEFRVLNELNSGTLIINTVYLKHWTSLTWESYTPELIGNDGTYSYFIVRNISGFSPFAVVCDYSHSSDSVSISGDSLPAYIKWLMFQEKAEGLEETETNEISESFDGYNQQTETGTEGSASQETANVEVHNTTDDSNSGYFYWIMGIGLVLILGIVVTKKQKGGGGL
ncbi:PKD domain-containing protein [Methanolobus sp. ZRKC5]|uniref:PKD domain-containing protein n=1 Tax=unclassified Methanolobus TaxID=2629569 RepID=UPI00313D5293